MEWLKDYIGVFEKEMVRAVPKDKEPWGVYGVTWDILRRGGKRIRPVMAMLSCEAVGGKREDALPAALAVELFHNFTLIHDDIEDNSQLRRGEPCLHIKFGIPLAINAGDGLFMMVFKSFLESSIPDKKKIKILHNLTEVFTKVLEGQGTEINWERENKWDVTEKDYFGMIEGKTASLIAGSCWAGAYIGGKEKHAPALKEFGRLAGILFQVKDDLLNLTGEEKKYRKEIGGDIAEGKRTLMVLHALKNLNQNESARLMEIIGKRNANQEEIKLAISLIAKSGSIEHTEEQIRQLYKNAKKELFKLQKSRARDRLEEILDFFVKREV